MQKQLSIGERIVDLRKAQSMSQKELAEKIGLSPSQLSRIENGLATTVTSDTLVALAQAFRVSTDYLLGLTAIRTPKNTDVAQLRLSETVLRRLLDGTLNADILNRLLEHRAFPYLLNLAQIYFADTAALGVTARNEMIDFLLGSLIAFSGEHPEHRQEIMQDKTFLKAQKLGAHEAEMEKIKEVFLGILRDIKDGMENDSAPAIITGADAMRQILADLPPQTAKQPTLEEVAVVTTAQAQKLINLDETTAAQFQDLMKQVLRVAGK